MENSLLFKMGIDPIYIIVVMFLLIIVLFIMITSANMKYSRLKNSYNIFMKGRDGKTLEDSFMTRFSQLEALTERAKDNQLEIREIKKTMLSNYQKIGIVKYDAFQEMGGKLSFAITMLDARDNGWIMNAMHSREGCYTYVKEIVKGKSYIELSEEEAESLERAIYQEAYGLDLDGIVNNEN